MKARIVAWTLLSVGAAAPACSVPATAESLEGASSSFSKSPSSASCPEPAATAPVPPTATPDAGSYAVMLDLPPRLQWEANDGYCGEMSFVIAGLHYGQYVSQYDARALASPGVPQSKSSSQLLLDANEVGAATAMKLRHEVWSKSGTTKDFLLWTKNHLVANHVVIAGIFENTKIFDFQASQGDDYDHIVPFVGYASSHPLTEQAVFDDDRLTLTDNGDYSQSVKASSLTFTYALSQFIFARAQQPNQPYYLNDGEDSAIAILGVEDPLGETMPVELKASTDSEQPEMVDGSDARPAPGPVRLTITVSGLTPGESYNLYRYSNFESVPTSSFNASAAKATSVTTINVATASVFVKTEDIMSNTIAIYRAVKASGP